MVTLMSGAQAANAPTDLIFNETTPAGSADSFAQQLISELQDHLNHSANGSHLQIDIQIEPSQQSGDRQFLVTVKAAPMYRTPAPTAGGNTGNPAASVLSRGSYVGQDYNYDPSELTHNPTFQQTTAAGQQAPSTVPTLDTCIARDMALLNSPFTTNANFLASMPQQWVTQRAGNPAIYDYNAGLTPLQQTIRLYQTLYPNSPEALIPPGQLDARYNATNPNIPGNVAPNTILTPQAIAAMSGSSGDNG